MKGMGHCVAAGFEVENQHLLFLFLMTCLCHCQLHPTNHSPRSCAGHKDGHGKRTRCCRILQILVPFVASCLILLCAFEEYMVDCLLMVVGVVCQDEGGGEH